MAVNWKTAIKPAAQSVEFKSAAVQMKPAERIANGMDVALAAFKNGESTKKRPAIVQKGSEVRFYDAFLWNNVIVVPLNLYD